MGAPTILISHTPDGGCTSACPTIAVPDCEDAALQAAESALAAAASATQASASAQTASSASESANAAVAGVLLAASNANTSAGQAASSASAASQSASAAAGSASTASASASTATARATQAAGSASSAASSATSAQTSAAAAATSAQTSTTKAAAAAASATAALASEATAHENAVATAVDRVAVAADKQAAELSKEAAQLSATEAAQSAFSAAQSAANAATAGAVAGEAAGAAAGAAAGMAAAQPFAETASEAADTATAQAAIATTQAGIATTQAGTATTQAGVATTQAGAATTKAGEAAASAAAALVSQTAAASSATQAALIAAGLNYIDSRTAATLPDPATRTAGDVYRITTGGTIWGKTFADNDLAIRNGAAGYDQLPANLWLGISAPLVSGKAPRGGIVSAGTSAVATTQDNPGLAFGTSNLTPGVWARANWSTASVFLLSKSVGGVGVQFRVINSVPRLTLGNGSTNVNFIGTAAAAVADGSWVLWNVTINRAGLATFYANAVQVGNPVDISSIAAQTFTNAAALTWFSDGGTNHSAGTIGECWIVAGLLSASRIADIYRAGSIAPFCVMTPNATTGQNTATIDGLSFFQWLECDQGYGPIIRDRSGNNQHGLMGTSGLFHAVRKNPPGVPQRAPRTALVNDGTTNNLIRATLNSQSPTTGDLTLWSDFVVPVTVPASSVGSAMIGPATTSLDVNTFITDIVVTTGDWRTRLTGANIADRRNKVLTGLVARFGGKRVVGIATRAGTAVRVYIAVDGDLLDITNLCTESTEGSAPPEWSGSITGTYFGVGYEAGAQQLATSFYDSRLANVAMTEAQLRAEYLNGEPGPEWIGASNAVVYTSDFSAGLGGWTTDGPGTERQVTGNVDGIAGEDDWLKAETLLLRSCYTYSNGVLTALKSGTAWAIVKIHNPAGSPFGYFTIGRTVGSSNSVLGVSKQLVAVPAGSTATFRVVFRMDNETRIMVSVSDANGGMPAVAAGNPFYVKSVTAGGAGWTTRLRTDTANGRQAVNDAKSATNDASHFTTSATGITVSPEPKRTEHSYSQASLTANGELLDTAGVIATDAVLVDVVVKNTTANEVTGFGIGMSSGTRDLTHETNIPANAVVVLPIKRADLAGCTVGTSPYGRIYYSAAAWNSGNLNLSIRYRRERDL
jgi:hypothetical protein